MLWFFVSAYFSSIWNFVVIQYSFHSLAGRELMEMMTIGSYLMSILGNHIARCGLLKYSCFRVIGKQVFRNEIIRSCSLDSIIVMII